MICRGVDLLLFLKYSLKYWLFLFIIAIAVTATVLISCPLDVVASLCDGSIAFLNQFTWWWKWWFANCWLLNIFSYICFNADRKRLLEREEKKIDYCIGFILFNCKFYSITKTSFIHMVNKLHTRTTPSTESKRTGNRAQI